MLTCPSPVRWFRPLATYFAVLLFTTASPLWWALVDVERANGWVTYHVVTALGILLIPVVTGLLIFGSWRAIGGLWRGIS